MTGKIPTVKAMKKRTQVPSWMDAYMDYGMILDIPAGYQIRSRTKSPGIQHTQEAVNATRINNDYFMKNLTVIVSSERITR